MRVGRARTSNSGRTLVVQKHIVRQSYNSFSKYCSLGLESVVYWYGLELHAQNVDVVMAVAIPNVDRYATCYEVTAEDAAKMGSTMSVNSLVCLAQFHTHPGSNTRHSVYDDQNSISTRNGFLSLVAPKYGRELDLDLDRVSVHEAWGFQWHLLTRSAKKRRIRVIGDVVDLQVGE